MKIKIGHSYDIHRLEEGYDLILGGTKIEHTKGLVGHSDADCLLHVVAESIMGALGIGDLGTLFPDNNPKFKGVDSSKLVLEVVTIMKKNGFVVNNIDTTIYCEKPKLVPHKLNMKNNIAKLLDIEPKDVNVKATTGEKIGVIGKEQGIACEAVVLLIK